MSRKTAVLLIRMIAVVSIVNAVSNIFEEGKMMIYDLNGILLGVGLLIVPLMMGRK
ncbi:MAG: hypothetical protein ABII02_03685 [Candidatus Magasanikbacteria bacterium]